MDGRARVKIEDELDIDRRYMHRLVDGWDLYDSIEPTPHSRIAWLC